MVRRLGAALQDAEGAVGVEGGFGEEFQEGGFAQVVRAIEGFWFTVVVLPPRGVT